MKIAILGLGYVGCTAAGCIASQGHHVIGIDVNPGKVETLNSGRSPVYEPGLDDLIGKARAEGRLEAVTEIGDKLDDCDIAIVCVGTPSGVDGAHNMGYIVQVTRAIATAVKPDRATPLTVVYRSTMRPGTTEQMIAPIFHSLIGENCDRVIELVYNPEFLREATAIEDYFNPPKIVLGTIGGEPSEKMVALHEGIDAPIFHVGIREAEITKFVDNTWHAVKVAFANEVGRVCQNLGISARQVHQIFVSDTKLNISAYYTRPGGPFGGSCLPKDVRALQHIAADTGSQTHLVDSLLRSNDAHKHHQFLQVTQGLEPGARVLLVGLSFKADTDDLRESPAVDMARKLLDAGYALDVYDPQLKPESLVGQNLGYAYAILPSIDGLLVDKATAQSRDYGVIVATNRLIKDLDLGDKRVVDVSAIA
ncbi:MAG: GDP-mannose dehydrogenase [Novosphingobium sp. 28-62-57]|uniref:nucleotide sugar dehydrogenase n=1 Tax=unclassified Novosphingobium TaxID=2644732 RepID=UPI000BD15AC5|nr:MULTISPECIES: nucleotide sugar dehydrogenase [unclassified Novosphingobium]OYW50366.1 MAG: GDP-mannose dehydrogenase [Novosphingobium sp. 12-62-10]OYZ11530.1 MAG: GDP-mannose dehydrogenase [Novosphingobium sp. 28-62-57]OZA38699.1 MAG: GDP-mannose dehydrogenase [Novosphingobium sp. 17-62-9]HQS68866.1 nucleotide sugar dehydrogenase [Novosphingobium sp.]